MTAANDPVLIFNAFKTVRWVMLKHDWRTEMGKSSALLCPTTVELTGFSLPLLQTWRRSVKSWLRLSRNGTTCTHTIAK